MSSAVAERETISASDAEREVLAEAESLLDRLSTNLPGQRPRLVGPAGEEIELPAALYRVLRQAAHHLLQGDSISIAPVHQQLTTQQAADLLNVSRPYLIRLLDDEAIPFSKTGTHRRIQLGDLLAYKRKRDTERRQGLKRLTELSQELGEYS